MKFNGALVKTMANKTIGVAVVDQSFLDLEPAVRGQRMMQFRQGFGGETPVVVLIASEENKEQYLGRPDLIDQLREIPLNMMTFKTWNAPEE